jgi:hypothetical protein
VSRFTSPVIELARALQRAGVTTGLGLAVVAEVWRPVELRPEWSIHELRHLNERTLQTLYNQRWLATAPDETYDVILRRWPFPLWPLDLRMRKVEKQDLRDIRSSAEYW